MSTRKINAHTHLYSGLAPLGMPAPKREPQNFVQILEEVWWKLDRALDEASLRASARYYVADALRRGCSGLIDHHESPNLIEGSLDILADACQELGMPAVLCYGATERNGGLDEANRGIDECKRFIVDNERPLVRGAVGLHACFTVSDDTLRRAAAVAEESKSVLHLHIAEDGADVVDAKERGYEGLVDRLFQCDALIEGSVFAHGVHLSTTEISRLTHCGIWLVQNPRSNHGNKVGYAQNLVVSPQVALGTDGYEADMGAELSFLLEQAAAHDDEIDVVSKRADASEELLATFFDGSVPECGSVDDTLFAEIETEAKSQASNLWQRMNEY